MVTIKNSPSVPTSYTTRCFKCGAILKYTLSDLKTRAQSIEERRSLGFEYLERTRYFIYCPNCEEQNFHHFSSETRPSFEEA